MLFSSVFTAYPRGGCKVDFYWCATHAKLHNSSLSAFSIWNVYDPVLLLSDRALCRCCISYISCCRLCCSLTFFLSPVVLKWFVEEKDTAAHADTASKISLQTRRKTNPVFRNVKNAYTLLGSMIWFRRDDCLKNVDGEVKEMSSPNSSKVVESSVSL